MLKLIIAGTITKDAELRRTGGGDAVCSFSIVVDNGKDRDGNRRDGTFIECSIWGKRAESVTQYLTKGTKLAVEGRPSVRAYNEKAYLQCSVDQFTFMGSNDSNRQPQQHSEPQNGYGAPRNDLDDDPIPFLMEWR